MLERRADADGRALALVDAWDGGRRRRAGAGALRAVADVLASLPVGRRTPAIGVVDGAALARPRRRRRGAPAAGRAPGSRSRRRRPSVRRWRPWDSSGRRPPSCRPSRSRAALRAGRLPAGAGLARARTGPLRPLAAAETTEARAGARARRPARPVSPAPSGWSCHDRRHRRRPLGAGHGRVARHRRRDRDGAGGARVRRRAQLPSRRRRGRGGGGRDRSRRRAGAARPRPTSRDADSRRSDVADARSAPRDDRGALEVLVCNAGIIRDTLLGASEPARLRRRAARQPRRRRRLLPRRRCAA